MKPELVKMMLIYLARSSKSKLADYLKKFLREQGYIVIDPFASMNDGESSYYDILDNGLQRRYAKLIYERDLTQVRYSDCVVAVFDKEDTKMIGISMEVMYAKMNNKNVIAVTNDSKLSVHPFLVNTTDVIVYDEDYEHLAWKLFKQLEFLDEVRNLV